MGLFDQLKNKSKKSGGSKKASKRKGKKTMFFGSKRNPANSGEFLKRALIGGLAGGAYEIVSEVAMQFVPWVRDREPAHKELMQGGLGIVLGLFTHGFMPNAAKGLAIVGAGDIAEGVLKLTPVQTWLRSLFAAVTPASTTAPAAGVYPDGDWHRPQQLPAPAPSGVPGNFRVRSAAACG